jgi:hypothetical protein
LRAAVAELDVPDPELTTRLLRGRIQAAASSIGDGALTAHVTDRTLDLIHRALGTAP